MTFGIYPSLKGRTVFITGGASGIGAELVSKITDHAAIVRVPEVEGKVLLAFLDMKEHGAMIHTSVPASASEDVAIAVSKLSTRLRQVFKASSAA